MFRAITAVLSSLLLVFLSASCDSVGSEPDQSIYVSLFLNDQVLFTDEPSVRLELDAHFTRSGGDPPTFTVNQNGDAVEIVTSGARHQFVELRPAHPGESTVNVTAKLGDLVSAETSFSVSVRDSAFKVLALTQISPVSPSAASHFPDSLRSGVLPHVIDGGYGHTGVLQPARSFWIVLESGELLMSYTEFQLALQYAVFTDGQPYGDGVLGERCSWTATGTYSTDEGHVVLSLYSEAYPGTSDGQAGIVDIDELLVEGCRQWAFHVRKWRMKDARFTSAD